MQVPEQCITPREERSNNESILTDFFDKGDLAAGLQAWLKLTNSDFPGLDSTICPPEDDAKQQSQ